MKKEELTVFVSDHCFSCTESLLIADQIKRDYPEIVVSVFNIDHARPQVDIFAVPTYSLNGEIVFLGNPTDEQIGQLFAKRSAARAAKK